MWEAARLDQEKMRADAMAADRRQTEAAQARIDEIKRQAMSGK